MLTVSPYSTPEGMKYGVYEDHQLLKLFDTEKDAQIYLILKTSVLNSKKKDPSPVKTIRIEPERKVVYLEETSATILKLRCIVSGIMAGQVPPTYMTDQHREVLLSFESYYSKNGYLTEKQFKWCSNILLKYNDVIVQLMKDGIKPVQFPTQSTASTSTEDHRKYERVVEFDEPKKKIMRGKLLKKEEE